MRSMPAVALFAAFTIFAPATTHAAWSHKPTDNLLIATGVGEQSDAMLCPDGAGGAIVAWTDGEKHNNVYAQRVSASGVLMWGPEGVPLCTEGHSRYARGIVSDDAGGAIVVWRDLRNGRYEWIFAQRVSPDGELLWAGDGVPIFQSTSAGAFEPVIASDGNHGAIIAFSAARPRPDNPSLSTIDIFAQHVDASGAVQWATNGILVNPVVLNFRSHPLIAADGSGGALIAWSEDPGSGKGTLSVQKIDASGVAQWNASGVAVGSTLSDFLVPALASDGNGGALLGWTDARHAPENPYTVATQHVDASGALLWGPTGLPVTEAPAHQGHAAILGDGAGGMFIFWTEDRINHPPIDGSGYDIFGQHFDASGARLWPEQGIVVIDVAGQQAVFGVVSDGRQGTIVAWIDRREIAEHIYAQHFDEKGKRKWKDDGVQITDASSFQPAIISDRAGGAILAWSDRRLPPYLSVFAQRVGRNGKLGTPGGPRPRASAEARAPEPLTTRLLQGQIAVRFELSRPGPVRFDLHDVSGRLRRAWGEVAAAGVQERRFDLIDDRGQALPSGVYFLQLRSNEARLSRRFVVTR